jgi:hypothetical protein
MPWNCQSVEPVASASPAHLSCGTVTCLLALLLLLVPLGIAFDHSDLFRPGERTSHYISVLPR